MKKIVFMLLISMFYTAYADISLVDKNILNDEVTSYETKHYVITDEESVQSLIDFSYKDLNGKNKTYKNNNYRFYKEYDPDNVFNQIKSRVYSITFDEKMNICILTDDGVLFKYPLDKFKLVIERGKILEKKELEVGLKEKISYYGLGNENVMIKYKISQAIPESSIDQANRAVIKALAEKGLLKSKKEISVYFFLPFNNDGKAYVRYITDIKSMAIKTKEISSLNIDDKINLR